MLEKSSNIGLFGLAIIELLFCVATLSGTFSNDTKLVYSPGEFSLYFMMYGHYFQNVSIKISATVTMIMSVYRYLAVSKPVQAKIYMNPKFTLIAICVGYIFWILYQLPLMWTWDMYEVHCLHNTYILLNMGIYESNKIFRRIMTYSWLAFGVIAPVCVLAFCNLRIIISGLYRMLTLQI